MKVITVERAIRIGGPLKNKEVWSVVLRENGQEIKSAIKLSKESAVAVGKSWTNHNGDRVTMKVVD